MKEDSFDIKSPEGQEFLKAMRSKLTEGASMYDIVCDDCGEVIGKCSIDLSEQVVHCEDCTPVVDEEDEEPVVDEKPED